MEWVQHQHDGVYACAKLNFQEHEDIRFEAALIHLAQKGRVAPDSSQAHTSVHENNLIFDLFMNGRTRF